MNKNQELLNVFNGSQTIFYPPSSWSINKYDIFYPAGLTLWGVYFLKYKEKKNPNLLLRRLIYSRMNSSSLLRTILIINDGYCVSNNTIKCLEKFFDVVFVLNDNNSIANLVHILNSDNKKVRFEIPNNICQEQELKRLKLSDMFNEIDYDPCRFSNCLLDSGNQVKVHNPFSGSMRTTQLFDFQGQLSFSKDSHSKSFINNYENLFTNVMLNNFSFESKKLEIRDDKFCIANTNFNFDKGEVGYNCLNTMLSMGVLPVSVNNNNEFNGLGRLWM